MTLEIMLCLPKFFVCTGNTFFDQNAMLIGFKCKHIVQVLNCINHHGWTFLGLTDFEAANRFYTDP